MGIHYNATLNRIHPRIRGVEFPQRQWRQCALADRQPRRSSGTIQPVYEETVATDRCRLLSLRATTHCARRAQAITSMAHRRKETEHNSSRDVARPGQISKFCRSPYLVEKTSDLTASARRRRFSSRSLIARRLPNKGHFPPTRFSTACSVEPN